MIKEIPYYRQGWLRILMGMGILFGLLMGSMPVQADEFPVVVEAEVKATLAAERAGVLSKLEVDAGDKVKKGELLAVVYHQDMILQKEQRKAQKKFLDLQVDNLLKLNEKGLVTDEELEKAKMEQAINAKQIRIIETEIERSKIYSPFSGFVVTRHVQPHEWVTPGQPVVELYNPGKLRVVADIPSEIAVGLEKGQEFSMFFPDLKQNVTAVFKVISPQVDVRSNTIKVYWTVAQAEQKRVRLLPGMKGVVKIGSN